MRLSCWFSHGDRLRERAKDEQGREHWYLTCQDCGDRIEPLIQPVTKGPKHTADVVPGQPRTKVLRRWPDRRKVIHG